MSRTKSIGNRNIKVKVKANRINKSNSKMVFKESFGNKYDVIIVGAGPAGIFAAREIIQKKPKTKVAIIEMGNRIENRARNEVMSGFGGAGTYSDGKLHFTPKLSHERTFHLIEPEEYQKILDEIDEYFVEHGVSKESYPTITQNIQDIIDNAQRNDIELIVRRVKHVSTDILKLIVEQLQQELETAGITIIDKTEVTDIIVEDNECKGVITKKGEQIYSNKVLLSPGRIKARWLQEIANKHNIEYIYDMVEIGVRVEFPESIMRELSKALYEIVFRVRTNTYDDFIRTFCSCPNGMVATEYYSDYICVNGHSNSDHQSANSNFAFVCEVNLTSPVENSITYAESIARMASIIGGGKPILQRFADLKRGRRSTWSRLKKSLVKPTLTDVTPGDISMALPHRIVTNIIEGLEKLNSVMPGVSGGSTLLYAPEVKLRSSKIKTTPDMQSTLKNVYVAGDASGLSGTITGAAATGIMAARGMMVE